jgi:hypothetical protein
MTNEVEKIAPIETTVSTNEPPAQPVAVSTNTPAPAVVVPMVEDPFTPRMFVQFFNKGSTNAPVSALAPIPFSPPPTSIPAPPSRATYEVK